jgi:hypothetical protein
MSKYFVLMSKSFTGNSFIEKLMGQNLEKGQNTQLNNITSD